jgi:hypothetical protein
VHSDTYMTRDRASFKAFIHTVRAETERYCGYPSPFAALESRDDEDLLLFPRMLQEGPPKRTYNPDKLGQVATVSDYAFWWTRIFNAHFAITDLCGHYPY